MLAQQIFSIFGVTISATIDPMNVVPCSFLDQFMSSLNKLFHFLNESKSFLNFPFWCDTLVFEAAMLANKQKVKIFANTPKSILDFHDKSFICTKIPSFNQN